MKKLLYDGFEVHEIVEHANPNAQDAAGAVVRTIWGTDRTEQDRAEAQKAGGRFAWAIYGHPPKGALKSLVISRSREEAVTLCEFLNHLVGLAKAEQAEVVEMAKPVKGYRVSIYLEEDRGGELVDFTHGFAVFGSADEKEADCVMKYAEDVLMAGIKHLKLSGKDFRV